MSRKLEKSYRVLSVTMPRPLVKELDAYCLQHERKRSYVIADAVKEFLILAGESG
jgi:metal-responsive CopG/Arc/MetJ family transcriptional regulator